MSAFGGAPARVLDLEGQDQADGLQALLAAVNIVSCRKGRGDEQTHTVPTRFFRPDPPDLPSIRVKGSLSKKKWGNEILL